jgi:hypothetical protein
MSEDFDSQNPYQPPASLAPPLMKPADEDPANDDPDQPPSSREEDAARAIKSAVVGVLFCPLQVYTAWLLLLVWMNDEPLRPRYFWYAVGAAAVLVPYAIFLGLFGIVLYRT